MFESMKRAKIRITGLVQGVFYRQSAREKARALGISGWVRNCFDGSVEAEIAGAGDKVDEMIGWCRVGPPHARVDGVDIDWMDETSNKALPHPFEIH